MEYLYEPLLRPAGFATLPQGITWDYVEAPASRPDIASRRGLPLSKHLHGIIAVSRELTPAECEAFDLRPVRTPGAA